MVVFNVLAKNENYLETIEMVQVETAYVRNL